MLVMRSEKNSIRMDIIGDTLILQSCTTLNLMICVHNLTLVYLFGNAFHLNLKNLERVPQINVVCVVNLGIFSLLNTFATINM